MKKQLVLILSLLVLGSPTYAQENDYNDDFFMAFHFTSYFDFIWSKLEVENAPTGNTIIVDGQEVAEYQDIPFQSFVNNVFSFGFEPRYNFHKIDDNSAFAVSSPISLGFGQVFSPPMGITVGSVEGFGSIQIPLLAKYYVGSGSTYDCDKDYGLSFGVGFEYNKVGLIRLDNTDIAGNYNKGFVLPVASLGVHFWRGYSPVELNIKYGHGKITEFYYDKYGAAIRDNANNIISGKSRARVLRASVSYLLNY